MDRGFTLYFVLLIVQFLYSTSTQISSSRSRAIRSIKDALPKDDQFSQTRVLSNMRHKVFSLEQSMQTVNAEVDKISKQNKEIQETVAEQEELMKKLNLQFDALQKVLSTHGDALGDLEKLASPAQNLFAMSNQTCGGILIGHSGSIVFSSAALRGVVRYPSSCVWTIRANNRAQIKISSGTVYRSIYSYSATQHATYVVEVLRNNTGNATTQATKLQTKVTLLQRNIPQVFSGPVVFVVYTLGLLRNENSDIDLLLHFEGLGKLNEKTTFFTHKNLPSNSGSFSFNDLQVWNPSGFEGDQQSSTANYTDDYTSIIVSNFSTKVHLQVEFGSRGCMEGNSFIVVTDLLENTTASIDCCKNNCRGKNSLINYENPYLILMTKKFQQPLDFNISWISETPYSPSTTPLRASLSSYQCGEVLGGIGGSIQYKPHAAYRNGERCIWVIVPQPRPRSSIAISIGANGVESTYDHLYMMELTDVNGTELVDAPRITRLGRYGSYEARSREVYIVFYSDSSVTGYGFSLQWRASGDSIKSGNDVTKRFNILRGDTGSVTSAQRESSLTNNFYQAFILTPVVPSSYSFGMQINLNQTLPIPQDGDCLHQEFKIFTTVDGVLTKAAIECSSPGQAKLENADGMAIIVMDSQNPSSTVAMDFAWKHEFGDANNTNIVVSNNNCGGVIIGERGILNYKISTDYLNNERCVWLLHSPNSTSITLKLLKDGFELCCDNILVNTIDPETGVMRNDTSIIHRNNRTRTYEESVLVIAFRSDASTRGKGFALQFSANGYQDNPEYHYQLRHYNNPYGAIGYPSSDWSSDSSTGKQVLVIASSVNIAADEDPLIMPTNISWSSGVFKKKNGSCTYDSITFYTTPDTNGWLQRERYPQSSDITSCPDQINVPAKLDLCSTVYSAFLVVYKLVSSEPDDSSQMGFTYEKSAGCGGELVGEHGSISYKEDGKYTNNEKCIWLISVPQGSKIRFQLERSGLEECCDVLVISTIDNSGQGLLRKAAVISQSNKTALVDGPVAVVAFTSDSSVIGDGFRLTFTMDSEITEEYPYTYHLDHQNYENTFAYQVEPNQYILYAYSTESHRHVTYTSPRMTINVQSFRPQIDLNCSSDALTFFEFLGKDKGLSIIPTTFTIGSTSAVNSTFDELTSSANCTELTDQNYQPCESFLDCGDKPRGGDLIVNSTAFVVVYKSVNASGMLRFRGFSLTVSV